MASTTIILPADYGYVVLVALGMVPVLSFAQGMIVGPLRKKAGVPYPNHYATAQQVKDSRDAYQLNAAQRAHGNLLENMSQTIAYMLVSGVVYPRASAITGLVWIASRILFVHGYVYSNKPNGMGRYNGTTFWLAQGALWGMSISVGLKMLSGSLV